VIIVERQRPVSRKVLQAMTHPHVSTLDGRYIGSAERDLVDKIQGAKKSSILPFDSEVQCGRPAC
jgi:hypothetical protein